MEVPNFAFLCCLCIPAGASARDRPSTAGSGAWISHAEHFTDEKVALQHSVLTDVVIMEGNNA